jgi:hypothetical protein
MNLIENFNLLSLNENAIESKSMLIGLSLLASLITINLGGNTAFAFPTHCDMVQFPSCYSIGSGAVWSSPKIKCPIDHIEKFCQGWNYSALIRVNNGGIQNVSKENELKSEVQHANTALGFNTNDFKIITFGVENHNPFVVVQGKAGASRGDESGDNEFGYIFYTDKGLFGAFSAFPNQPYTSSHFTEENINGHICLNKAQKAGHVVTNGHKLIITGIHINKINKVMTKLFFTDSDNGNCVNKVYSSKP